VEAELNDRKLDPAINLMGRVLAGISMTEFDEVGVGVDLHVDGEAQRVWAEVALPTGDVYEVSARWVREKSP
jgi:hypothetical protein